MLDIGTRDYTVRTDGSNVMRIPNICDTDISTLGIGSIAIADENAKYVWELGMRGSIYGIYKTETCGRIWWPVYCETLDEAECLLRFIARTYNFKLVNR